MLKRVAALAVVLLVVAAAPAQPPRAAPVGAKFVPPPFFAALVFEPGRLDKSATAAGLPIGEAWKAVEGIAGTDVKRFERVTCLIDPFPGGNVAFMPAFVLRYPAGADARKELNTLLGDVKEAKVGDVTYLRSTKHKLAMVEMAGYAIDDRTLLVAAWPTLEPMLKPDPEKGKDRLLGAALAKTDFDHDAVLVVTPAPGLKRVDDVQKKGPKPDDAPAIYKELKPALERLTTVTVSVDLGKAALLRAEFRCDTAAGAGTVHDALKGLLSKAKGAYPEVRKELEKDLPPEAAKPILAILDEAVNGHTLTKDGTAVVLTVARPKELTPKK